MSTNVIQQYSYDVPISHVCISSVFRLLFSVVILGVRVWKRVCAAAVVCGTAVVLLVLYTAVVLDLVLLYMKQFLMT